MNGRKWMVPSQSSSKKYTVRVVGEREIAPAQTLNFAVKPVST